MLRSLLLAAVVYGLVPTALSQTSDAPCDDYVETDAAVVGGADALQGALVLPENSQETGWVRVETTVLADGSPAEARCAEGASPQLCQSARDAVLAQTFEPARDCTGAPQPVRTAVPVWVGPPGPRRAEVGDIFEVVERAPELIGGLEALQRLVDYPTSARRAGVEGTVYVQFVVDEQGTVTELVVPRSTLGESIRPLGPDPTDRERLRHQRAVAAAQDAEAAALRAVRAAQFRPGFQEGRPVKVRFTMPIQFKLR